nr:immunoglobulin heavy chain junction region [Macaca mulatta]MOV43270.1 immunoglobulin heavy chain junction region [Macaca mulatta]MOV45810.1 immunoglobulin heavy chain junction region [Macaca mulatta]MOV46456.1 immunoglobulin heavy chain junction region [Macaca mulatta]MOV47361.1 immunoglobulin heavy chain junction region [Macaca mulatta]
CARQRDYEDEHGNYYSDGFDFW